MTVMPEYSHKGLKQNAFEKCEWGISSYLLWYNFSHSESSSRLSLAGKLMTCTKIVAVQAKFVGFDFEKSFRFVRQSSLKWHANSLNPTKTKLGFYYKVNVKINGVQATAVGFRIWKKIINFETILNKMVYEWLESIKDSMNSTQ